MKSVTRLTPASVLFAGLLCSQPLAGGPSAIEWINPPHAWIAAGGLCTFQEAEVQGGE
jgi:hypothetical protein